MRSFLLCFLIVGLLYGAVRSSMTYPSLLWNPQNPIFTTNISMNVLPMSKIHVVCPNPANVPTILYDSVPKERMHENLWIVDKAAYDTCTVDTSRNSNRLLRVCDNPLQLTYYTLVFQMFSATATGLEFQPGNTYYLIATSDGTITSLSSVSGGHCASHNMRIAFYVCLNDADPKCKESSRPSTNVVTTTVCPTPTPTATPLSTSSVPTTSPVPVAAPYPASEAINEIVNNTQLIPRLLQTTDARLSAMLLLLQAMNTQVNSVRSKLDNCTLGAGPGLVTEPPAATMQPTTTPPPVPKNCLDVYTTGSKVSGVYIIDPADGSGPFKVFCDHVTDGGGWTVFQKRFDGSVNFKRTWQEYSDGFGDLSGEFWLGLNKIHCVAGRPVTLRVDLTAPDGEKRHANYNGFSVGDAASKYKLTAGKYSGDAGDSLTFSDGQAFSTFDQDNDEWAANHCAAYFQGAWWHKACHESSLNGIYRNGSHPKKFADGVIWKAWKGYQFSLSGTEMKVRP